MEKPELKDMSDNLQLYFILLQPFIHGNPGNATVMAKLMQINSTVDMELAEKGFREKHPNIKMNPDGYGLYTRIFAKMIYKRQMII